MPIPEDISTRRTLQQIRHCLEEADGVLERNEPRRLAIEDLVHGSELLEMVIRRLREEEKAARR